MNRLPLTLCLALASLAAPASPLAQTVSDQAPAAAVPVTVGKPLRGPVSKSYLLPATATAYERAEIKARIVGTVAEVKVDLGDRVKAGQLLALIDAPDLEQLLLQAQARLTVKETLLAQAEGPGLQEAKARRAAAVSHCAASLAVAEFKMAQLKRAEQLAQARAATPQQLEQAQAEQLAAHADTQNSQASLLLADSAIAMALSQIEVLKSEAALARSQVAAARTSCDWRHIQAPFDGVVTARLAERGSLAGNTILFAVERTDSLRLGVDIPEIGSSSVRPGLAVKVLPYDGALPRPDAKISRISGALAAATRSLHAEIDLPNPDGQWLPGHFARVSIPLETHAHALSVPAAALAIEGKDAFLFLARNGKAVKQAVKLGFDDGLRCEIVSGLKDDDDVVLLGRNLLRDGQMLSIQTAEKAP